MAVYFFWKLTFFVYPSPYGRIQHRLAHKSSSKFFSSAKRELEIFYVFGGKVSKKPGAQLVSRVENHIKWCHFGARYLRPDWSLLPKPETRSERCWDSLDTTMKKGRSEVCAESENVETEADRKNVQRMSKKMCMPQVLGTNYFTELPKTVLTFWEAILSSSITHKLIKITATQAISFLQPATTILIWSVGLFPWQAGIKIQ